MLTYSQIYVAGTRRIDGIRRHTRRVCGAGAIPSLQEMTALLEKAESQETFAAEGASLFHIVASVRNTMEAQGKPAIEATGTYEILWQDLGRYREEFSLGMIWETDVANETELYIKRSGPFLPYSLWLLRSLTSLPVRRPGLLKRERPKVESVKASGADLICAELVVPPPVLDPPTALDVSGRAQMQIELESLHRREVCLDPTTHQIVSRHDVVRHSSESVFDDFANFGGARYPRHIVFKELGSTSEIKVEKLEPVDHFAADAFVPPPSSTRRDWCPAPHLRLPPSNSGLLIPVLVGPDAVYSVLVGMNGKAEKVTRLFPDGRSEENDAKRFPWRYAAKDCAGKGIEYETITSKQSVPSDPQ
jgi:hypothetical protein